MLRRLLCRILIALAVWAPYQFAQASMIGTDQVASASAAAQSRAHVMGLLERADIVSQMQTMGLDASKAKERVAAMTDEEVSSLSNRIDSLPAGGLHGWGTVLVIAIIVGVIWWVAGGHAR